MYTSVASYSISTGVPAAVLAVAGYQQWGLLSGVALVIAGLFNLLMLLRAHRQLERQFT